MEEDMNELIPNEVGIWIECSASTCKKWRYVLDIDDPLMVPEKWYCHMNSDKSVNTCSAPERVTLEEDEVFVESKYKAGSIVWAKVIGYPWCPAMVDFCPDFETYYWFDNPQSNVPTQYHVKLFDHRKQSRAWIKSNFVKPFIGNDRAFALNTTVHGRKLTMKQREKIEKNCKTAQAALSLPIQQRLKKFSYKSWLLFKRLQKESTDAKRQFPVKSKNSTTTNDMKKQNSEVRQPLAALSQNVDKRFDSGESSGTKIGEKKKLQPTNVEQGKSEPSTSKILNIPGWRAGANTLQSSMDTQTNSTSTTSREYEDSNDTESVNSSNFSAPTYAGTSLRSRLPRMVKRHIVEGVREESGFWKRREETNKKMKNDATEIFTGNNDLVNGKTNEIMEAEESSFESIPNSPQPGPSRLASELKSWGERRKKRIRLLEERRSKSQGFMRRYDDKENGVIEEPRYCKTPKQFSSTDKPVSLGNVQSTKLKTNKTHKLPEGFANVELRHAQDADRISKYLSELSIEISDKIKRETRESILSEISASSTTSFLERTRPAVEQSRMQSTTPEDTDRLSLSSADNSFVI